DGLVAVQTPQAFRAASLRAAHAAGGEATDDASLVEAAGGKVVVVDGSPLNLKITNPHDLAVAEALLRAR
ncbi:MAG TPA: 2-C-methyl-D-erythritol 4-phosphate cytidylyltransferase, partial [Acidimicrobiales bacterium]|nr:2-C-methyl-D-erythritol 4-phosphate cytidylyltransferase [Acidimicrobiales bacterium]